MFPDGWHKKIKVEGHFGSVLKLLLRQFLMTAAHKGLVFIEAPFDFIVKMFAVSSREMLNKNKQSNSHRKLMLDSQT